MNPDNFFIILVKPQGPINIGSVCRVMMNFGFTRLRLVAPNRNYRSLPAKKMALSAFPVLEAAGVFEDLASALADIRVSFGTTRRFGKYREHYFTPAAAAGKLREYSGDTPAALVMGPEDNGLETKDLDLCTHLITIPTHDGFPSMNLSHALAILLYEIAASPPPVPAQTRIPGKKPASSHEIEHMMAHMKETLLSIDFLDPQNPDHLLRVFRRIFGVSGLTSREVNILQGLMSRIDWTENERRKNAHVHHG